ncbi:MAG: hypothetical protein PHC51_06530 [bacterium]|nr:hypothetical protein [bacterium]
MKNHPKQNYRYQTSAFLLSLTIATFSTPLINSSVAENESAATLSARLEASEKKIAALEKKQADSAASFNNNSTQGVAGLANYIDTSLVIVGTAGGSSAKNDDLPFLQPGGHDPKRNGFSLNQAELSFSGNIDPYLRAESHFVFHEGDGVETEEAFITSTALDRLEIEAGYMLTEFGRINPQHPHQWTFIDSPIVNTRLLGAEGMRAAGIRMAKILPLPWFSELHLTLQNSDGEFMHSFRSGGASAHVHDEAVADESEQTDETEGELSIGGLPSVATSTNSLNDFVYVLRTDNFFDLSDSLSFKMGVSSALGPNSSGNNGSTILYGSDLILKWLPTNNFRGYPYVTLQGEYIGRNYNVDNNNPEALELSKRHIRDSGFYTQIEYGFIPSWAIAARGELAKGSGDTLIALNDDEERVERSRISSLLSYRPSEFSRLRLQYNYDQTDYLESNSHTVWLGFDIVLGKHPAHNY